MCWRIAMTSGIDVNRSASMLIAHNTLINTAGIDVRGSNANATVYGNLLDGRIRERDGAQAKVSMNEVLDLSRTLEDADALRLNWRLNVEAVPSHPFVKDDLCGTARNNATQVGALGRAEFTLPAQSAGTPSRFSHEPLASNPVDRRRQWLDRPGLGASLVAPSRQAGVALAAPGQRSTRRGRASISIWWTSRAPTWVAPACRHRKPC